MTWHITLAPIRMDASLTLSADGDVLTINGEALELSALADGDVLEGGAVDHPLVSSVDPIRRVGAMIYITVLLPTGYPAPEAARFAAPIEVTEDGPIALPAGVDP
jgi:hypothetical protein